MRATQASSQPSLQLKKLLPASPQEVFDAWTDPDSLTAWFCPGDTIKTEAQMDVRIGGHYRIVMRGEQTDYIHTGEYCEIVPARRLVFTWRSTMTHNEDTLVTVEFIPSGHAGQDTELILTHKRLPSADVAASYNAGWQTIVEKCAAYVQHRATARIA